MNSISRKNFNALILCAFAVTIIILNRLNSPILLCIPVREYIIPGLILLFSFSALVIAAKDKLDNTRKSVLTNIIYGVSCFIVGMYMLFFLILLVRLVFKAFY